MRIDDAPAVSRHDAAATPSEPDRPLTRRGLRRQKQQARRTAEAGTADRSGDSHGIAALATAPIALPWVGASTLTDVSVAPALDTASTFVPIEADLLPRAPRRSPWRPGVLVPAAIIALLVALYAATTLLWPLNAVAPEVTAVQVQPIAAPAAAPVWPEDGSAAVSVAGIDGTLSSTTEVESIASITKVITALLVLDRMPLAPGEQGPEFRFGYSDSSEFWRYLSRDESALDVPVDGSLSQYQMLQGMLIGSANNYAARLAGNLWPNDEVFSAAADNWLTVHGVTGITVVDPTGIRYGNTASAAALIPLAERALADPVIAEIVASKVVELPGAGLVENTNNLLDDPGVVGIKTGGLDTYNLLSAKDVTVGDTTVRLYAAVLGQPDRDSRDTATRALYAQLEQELQLQPSVTAGAVAGTVSTIWGEKVDLVTASDAEVILWNGGSGTVTTRYSLGDKRDSGQSVGTLAVAGPLDSTSVKLLLAADIEPPSAWWRLTHPLELFGLKP